MLNRQDAENAKKNVEKSKRNPFSNASDRGFSAYRLYLLSLLAIICILILSACDAGTELIVPTDPPTVTPTFTPSPSRRTPGRDATPTQRPTQIAQVTGGPS